MRVAMVNNVTVDILLNRGRADKPQSSPNKLVELEHRYHVGAVKGENDSSKQVRVTIQYKITHVPDGHHRNGREIVILTETVHYNQHPPMVSVPLQCTRTLHEE